MESSSSSMGRSVQLYCPTASKIAQIMAWEDQNLDLGTIARIFGIEPSTLKLNGHFISRGVDLVASSVTWKSLLSFFSSRGLSTGSHGSAALIVDGKLTKSGTKRSAEIESRGHCSSEGTRVGENHKHKDIDSRNYKKLKDNKNVCYNKGNQTVKCNGGALKRKHWLENISPFKRLRVVDSFSKEGDKERGDRNSSISKIPCGFLQRESMKRMREDEMLVISSSCKRAR